MKIFVVTKQENDYDSWPGNVVAFSGVDAEQKAIEMAKQLNEEQPDQKLAKEKVAKRLIERREEQHMNLFLSQVNKWNYDYEELKLVEV